MALLSSLIKKGPGDPPGRFPATLGNVRGMSPDADPEVLRYLGEGFSRAGLKDPMIANAIMASLMYESTGMKNYKELGDRPEGKRGYGLTQLTGDEDNLPAYGKYAGINGGVDEIKYALQNDPRHIAGSAIWYLNGLNQPGSQSVFDLARSVRASGGSPQDIVAAVGAAINGGPSAGQDWRTATGPGGKVKDIPYRQDWYNRLSQAGVGDWMINDYLPSLNAAPFNSLPEERFSNIPSGSSAPREAVQRGPAPQPATLGDILRQVGSAVNPRSPLNLSRAGIHSQPNQVVPTDQLREIFDRGLDARVIGKDVIHEPLTNGRFLGTGVSGEPLYSGPGGGSMVVDVPPDQSLSISRVPPTGTATVHASPYRSPMDEYVANLKGDMASTAAPNVSETAPARSARSMLETAIKNQLAGMKEIPYDRSYDMRMGGMMPTEAFAQAAMVGPNRHLARTQAQMQGLYGLQSAATAVDALTRNDAGAWMQKQRELVDAANTFGANQIGELSTLPYAETIPYLNPDGSVNNGGAGAWYHKMPGMSEDQLNTMYGLNEQAAYAAPRSLIQSLISSGYWAKMDPSIRNQLLNLGVRKSWAEGDPNELFGIDRGAAMNRWLLDTQAAFAPIEADDRNKVYSEQDVLALLGGGQPQ